MESNFNNEQKFSNLEKGLQLVREGNLHQADICFDAEMTQAGGPNFNVFVHHGHLLNRLGRYKEANDKFDSYLNTYHDDVSCLFGKGISNMGLLKLDDALSLFKRVIDIKPNHADAHFYSAIIHYYSFNLSEAKESYSKYQNYRKEFFNNDPEFFNLLGDDLSCDNLKEYYDEIHNFYDLRDLFIFINQLLERDCADNSNEYSNKQLKLLNDDEKEADNLFKNAGYDEQLIDDLESKYGELTIENKRTLIKIMDFFKKSDLSFKDTHDLIRKNVLEGNESIDSFYQNIENIINSHIDGNRRKNNRSMGEIEKLKEEIVELNKSLNSVIGENMDLKDKINKLKEKNSELSNKINTIKEDKSDSEPRDNISIFGDDFKYANSLNMISGINHEDYHEDLGVIYKGGDIPEDELSIFETGFENYNEGNFYEAYEHFKELSSNFEWQQEYIDFLKATSLSRANKFKEAYVDYLLNTKITKLGEKYNKKKYPIRWFNFGNICFDYANSQSGGKAKDAFAKAIYCYKNAKEIVSDKKSKSESKSSYKFNFKDENKKEDFEKNVQRMSKRAEICKKLFEIEKLKSDLK